MAPEKRKKHGFFSRLFEREGIDGLADNIAAAAEEAERAKQLEAAASELMEKRRAEAAGEAAPDKPRASWFKRLAERLTRTRRSLLDNIRGIIGLSGKLDEETLEEIEAALVQNDVSVPTALKIIERMKAESKKRGAAAEGPDALLDVFKESVRDLLSNAAPGFDPTPPMKGPYVVMMVGVNGAGKTTTLAKMAKRTADAGLSTMMVAGDTFRAAAVEQLEVWAGRTGCDFAKAAPGADAAALCYDALQRALSKGTKVVFIDTAGRLQTKSGLMDELAKVERVIAKLLPGAPHETLLVLDATTGQNALAQVRTFSAKVKVTGLVMTKLDGTAKGGVLLSILDEFKIPITLIGVGEGADDLRDFDPDQFAAALFGERE